MKNISELEPFLSTEGREFLSKWGIRLVGLYEGCIQPSGNNERRFVETFEKGLEPEGVSERIWFNMIGISELINRCVELEAEIARGNSVRHGLTLRINKIEEDDILPLKAEIVRLKRALQACHQGLGEYEKILKIDVPSASSREGERCPVCKGTGGMGNCAKCDGKGYL